MSRPKRSVPSGCSRLGFWRASAKFTSYGSYGENSGQIRQKSKIARKMSPAANAPRFLT
jgi:hypothetical protein